MRELRRRRTTEEARQALSNFCKAVGTAGDKRVHIFTIPLDEERDADCILSDVITERDLLRQALEEIRSKSTPESTAGSIASRALADKEA